MSDIDKIKKLRSSTGAGFKDCSAAIQESNGDLDKAAEILVNLPVLRRGQVLG